MKHKDDYRLSNREKAKEPKLGKTWCGNCDGCLVGDGEKCRNCGKRHPNKRAPRRDYR